MKIDWQHIGIKDLAALVSRKLDENDIDALIVGGACVSIYTRNKYLSSDIDFISHASLKDISKALAELGFKRESSRHFERKACPFFIEFVSPPAAIGEEPLKEKAELRTRYGKIALLTPTDSTKDRLSAYYHWNDPQALEQALMVAKAQRVNLKEVERWSVKEGQKEKYDVFAQRLRKKDKKS
ncbi:MAG: hypothetical protein A3K22_02315 [Deltaproteobacteria bacterium RBG_16_42_7]|nr:MAG: hypothetical protein A3K22_02315 [Deltaproteobacteria bacterium RBG_16_42_7]